MRYSEFRCKDVINIKDCRRLGRVTDFEFDDCGCIHSIIIPGGNKLFSFLHCEQDIIIPYKDIRQIGPDIILIDIKR
ncbi:MAG: YlmC/YmxH family sporulation protein [Clostridium sp.]|nr:YlmC/YmxH family sporulation protein [Clostridium sp.]